MESCRNSILFVYDYRKKYIDRNSAEIFCEGEMLLYNVIGEYLAEPHGWPYKDCYLTYDGTEKTLDYVVRNIYTDEIIETKVEVTLHYSKEPSEGNPGYKADAVKERGMYYLVVDDIRYNIEKYFFAAMETVRIYVQ